MWYLFYIIERRCDVCETYDHYSVIFMDINMPIMDGFDTTLALKSG